MCNGWMSAKGMIRLCLIFHNHDLLKPIEEENYYIESANKKVIIHTRPGILDRWENGRMGADSFL